MSAIEKWELNRAGQILLNGVKVLHGKRMFMYVKQK